MGNNIMLGTWGLGRKLLLNDSSQIDNNMKEFIKQFWFSFNWKLMKSIEDDLEKGIRQPSFAVPPLSRNSMGNVDMIPFILFEKVVMDRGSYNWLVNEGLNLPITRGWSTKESISILEGLREKGILVLVDYSQILQVPQQASILRAMTYLDINDKFIDKAWMESVQLWMEFLKSGKGVSKENDRYLVDIISHLQIILDLASRGVVAQPGENWYWMYLADCLSDVNCGLLVSRVLDMPILDWDDYRPFYKYKFSRALHEVDSQDNLHTMRRLFDIFVPSFSVRDVDDILALREDKRLEAVRELARTTKPESVTNDFVHQAISDVLKYKDKVQGFSKVLSLVTLPIGFIPLWGTPLQFMVQKVAEGIYDKYMKGEYAWQFFFTDLYTDYSPKVLEYRFLSLKPK